MHIWSASWQETGASASIRASASVSSIVLFCALVISEIHLLQNHEGRYVVSRAASQLQAFAVFNLDDDASPLATTENGVFNRLRASRNTTKWIKNVYS